MGRLSLDSRLRICEDAVFRALDGEGIILDMNAGVYYGLDPVGTRLWELIEAHGALRPVFEAACVEFEVDAATLERDLIDLVEDLTAHRLVEVE